MDQSMMDNEPAAEPVGIFVWKEEGGSMCGGTVCMSVYAIDEGRTCSAYHAFKNSRAASSCTLGAGQCFEACAASGALLLRELDDSDDII